MFCFENITILVHKAVTGDIIIYVGIRYEAEWAKISNHGDKFYATTENRTWDLPHARRLYNHCAMEAGIDKISHIIIYLVCTDFLK